MINLFCIFEIPEIPVYNEETKRKIAGEVVKQVSRNRLISSGNYITQDDIDRMKKELL